MVLSIIAAMSNTSDSRAFQFFADCADIVAGALARSGIDKATASDAALSVSEAMRERFRGTYLYVPKDMRPTMDERALRVHQLWREGKKIPEIALSMDISVIYAYRLLARSRASQRSRKTGT